ncbi:hypothetical protein BDF21DRAFT_397451 [Thamnidium elegans]|nr:hypothetical protein BDF21DRAFT_397451 [Thamnidium elegans]
MSHTWENDLIGFSFFLFLVLEEADFFFPGAHFDQDISVPEQSLVGDQLNYISLPLHIQQPIVKLKKKETESIINWSVTLFYKRQVIRYSSYIYKREYVHTWVNTDMSNALYALM